MAFSLVYRGGQPSEVTGIVSFLFDFAQVLFAEGVTRWGMLVAVIQGYFLIRLIMVGVYALMGEGVDWMRLIR